jgi:hypothetical protein
MAIAKIPTHKHYTHYAEHCVALVTETKKQDAHAIKREMAAEWLRLADSVRPR